jgi:hypothetical protein
VGAAPLDATQRHSRVSALDGAQSASPLQRVGSEVGRDPARSKTNAPRLAFRLVASLTA